MSKSQTITRHTTVDALVSKADDAVLSLARLLGRQTARELAALEPTPDTSPNGGTNDRHLSRENDSHFE